MSKRAEIFSELKTTWAIDVLHDGIVETRLVVGEGRPHEMHMYAHFEPEQTPAEIAAALARRMTVAPEVVSRIAVLCYKGLHSELGASAIDRFRHIQACLEYIEKACKDAGYEVMTMKRSDYGARAEHLHGGEDV